MAANRAWLEECVVHLLCVLALDRFGDYVSDQVATYPASSFAAAQTADSHARVCGLNSPCIEFTIVHMSEQARLALIVLMDHSSHSLAMG